jgi:hypothetical protein
MTQEPDPTITGYLTTGRNVFLPGATNRDIGGWYTYLRRRFGLYFHSRQHMIDGQGGMLVWADSQPPENGSAKRKRNTFIPLD